MQRRSFSLPADAVVDVSTLPSKAAALSLVASTAARAYSLDAAEVERILTEREQQGSTGFGDGIAIPHGKLDTLGQPSAVLLTTEKPFDFVAMDGRPVDIVFALLSPRSSGAGHLRALSEISRMLRDREFVEKIRGCRDSDALFAMVSDYETRDAA